jgi:hypothetical protein
MRRSATTPRHIVHAAVHLEKRRNLRLLTPLENAFARFVARVRQHRDPGKRQAPMIGKGPFKYADVALCV